MINPPHRPEISRCRASSQERGFALIITISLMMLLTLMAVGLLSLSTVSLRASSQGSAAAEARANARLGMMLALGELQKQLGPDQRVTAEAGLTQMESGSRAHWVGSYRSWLDTEEKRPDPEFLRWLVSGDHQTLTDESSASGGPVAERMITWSAMAAWATSQILPARSKPDWSISANAREWLGG